jgi:hypothetical protein
VIGSLAIMIVVLCATASVGSSPVPPSGKAPVDVAEVTPMNSTYCGLLASSGEATAVPDAAMFFAKLCNETSFIDLVSEWGDLREIYPNNGTEGELEAANLTLGESGGSDWNDTTFSINWLSGANCTGLGTPCVHQAGWFGNQSTGTLTGPYFGNSPDICEGCMAPAYPYNPPFFGLAAFWVIGVLGAVAVLGIIVTLRRRGARPPSGAEKPAEAAGTDDPALRQ